jgi:type I restriction-modification system DNA methylase subunit
MPSVLNKKLTKIVNKDIPNDKIYTPLKLAKIMIDMCNISPNDIVLDPSKGGGVFYDNLPECNKKYCEIDEGIDFFDFNEKVDIIVGNPPYSLWNEWLKKSIELKPNKICYLFGILNLTPKRVKYMEREGYYITKMYIVRVSWWFLISVGVLFERKNEKPLAELIYDDKYIYCDTCNRRCDRQKKGYNPNICAKLQTLKPE